MLMFGQGIMWVVIIKMTQLLELHLVAKDILPLEVTPLLKYPYVYVLCQKLIKSSSLMVKFRQDIACVAIIKMTQLLALHLVAKHMVPLEVNPYSSKSLHIF